MVGSLFWGQYCGVSEQHSASTLLFCELCNKVKEAAEEGGEALWAALPHSCQPFFSSFFLDCNCLNGGALI